MLFKISNCYPDRKTTIELIADKTNELQYKDIIGGQGIVWVWSNDSSKPLQPVVCTFHNDKTLITFENTTGKTQYITKESASHHTRNVIKRWRND